MMDDFEQNQDQYYMDDELSDILNCGNTEDSERLRRSMKKSQYNRIVRKKSMMIVRLRGLLRFILTLGILYFAYRLMAAHYWYLPKDTITSYRIKKIQIVGNKITPTYKIITAISGIELPNVPIYMIKTEDFSSKILSLAPVKKVYVKRLWAPARIIIYVEEKEPILIIAPDVNADPVAFYTKEGTLIGRDYLPLDSNYNPILILSYGNSDDDYTKWDKEKVLNIERLTRTIEKYSGETVEYIDMRKPNDIFIKLTSAKIRVGEINHSVYNRIKDIKSILDKTKTFEEKIQYIDLSWENSKFIKLGNDKEEEVINKDKETQKNNNEIFEKYKKKFKAKKRNLMPKKPEEQQTENNIENGGETINEENSNSTNQ